ncbi:MAG: glycosyltransferase [Euryarchaeota archaeon]|nr:glycosyltransferase [Euryarchaeota archaeon]
MLPALNEEDSIGDVISDIPVHALHEKGYDTEIVVIDGNSVDRTLEIARQKGARIIIQNGRGKGLGVRQALALCHPPEREHSDSRNFCEGSTAMRDAKYLVMLDADGTYPPVHILDLIDALEKGAEVVMGSRFLGAIAEGAMTKLNRFGNNALSDIATLLYQQRCTDLCTGMWGFNARALDILELDSRHFELEAELFAESAKKGLDIVEIPITYLPRQGETKLVPLKAGFAILDKLIERRFFNASGILEMKTAKRSEKRSSTPFQLL